MSTNKIASILVLFAGLLIASSAYSQSDPSISTDGIIESKTGFRFEDGSEQYSAAEDLLYNLACDEGQATIYDAVNLTWVCADPLQGPTGEKGDTGDKGDDGADGAPGTSGADGADGANCYDGIGTTTADCIGAKGDTGDEGASGEDGTSCTVAACPAEGVTTLSCGDGSQVQIACIPPTYDIGDTGPGGGIVFSITDGGLHGLEAAPVPPGADPLAPWCPEPNHQTNIVDVVNLGHEATVDPNSGAINTPLIADVCGSSSAAGVAAAHAWPEGQTDGFLPNKEELDFMYSNLHIAGMGGFSIGYYWSSSEYNGSLAWRQDFVNGSHGWYEKRHLARVRAVRAF